MSIVLLGLNHRTTPVEVREQLARSAETLYATLVDLIADDRHTVAPLREAVLLSTCNRFEVYVDATDAPTASNLLRALLAQHASEPPARHLYCRTGRDAIHHLMRVAAGLDSLVLGETQILGQVAQAWSTAHAAGGVGPLLTHLFGRAVHAGRRVRRETSICGQTTSISHAAAVLIQRRLRDRASARVLIVGAGEMAGLGAQALHLRGFRQLACINRTFERADALARSIEGQSMPWTDLVCALGWADVVFTATGAPEPVIRLEDVGAALPLRGGRPLWFVDVALPRDVEDAVVRLPGVRRVDIDDLQSVVDAHLAERQAAVPRAEALVGEEVDSFVAWLNGREVGPIIAGLRFRAEALAASELAQALQRLDDLDPHTQRVVTLLAHRIVGKLLHEPITRLKTQAARGNGSAYAEAVRELFALDVTQAPGDVVTSHV